MIGGGAISLWFSGCQSPAPSSGSTVAKPDFGPSVTDGRTEATILQMENDYIAAKNSPPPRPEQAAAMKKMEQKRAEAAKAEQAKAQAEQEKQQAAKSEAGK